MDYGTSTPPTKSWIAPVANPALTTLSVPATSSRSFAPSV
jgi:hypothetical protein